jgi:hypothetical protein
MAHPDDSMTDALKASIRYLGDPENGCTFGTTAAYSLSSKIAIRKIGFADLKVLELYIETIEHAMDTLVPILRQALAAELQKHGMPLEAVRCTPSIQRGARCMFLDTNEGSATKGQKRRGIHHTVHFEIEPAYERYFEFSGSHGKFKEPPNG